jgi:hypothetical protein
VLSLNGQPIARARITLTDAEGNSRSALTNQFGSYRFENVQAGQIYIFSITSKKHNFSPQAVTVSEALSELDFVAKE